MHYFSTTRVGAWLPCAVNDAKGRADLYLTAIRTALPAVYYRRYRWGTSGVMVFRPCGGIHHHKIHRSKSHKEAWELHGLPGEYLPLAYTRTPARAKAGLTTGLAEWIHSEKKQSSWLRNPIARISLPVVMQDMLITGHVGVLADYLEDLPHPLAGEVRACGTDVRSAVELLLGW